MSVVLFVVTLLFDLKWRACLKLQKEIAFVSYAETFKKKKFHILSYHY